MANLFQESFDWATTVSFYPEGKWTQLPNASGCSITAAAGGHGTNGFQAASVGSNIVSGGMRKQLVPSGTRVTLGQRIVINTLTNLALSTDPLTTSAVSGTCHFGGILLSGAIQVWVRPNTDGTLSAYRGATLLGTTALAISPGVQFYLELDAVIQSSGGSLNLYVNGVNWLTLSGIDTAAGADGYDGIVSVQTCRNNTANVTIGVDDLYVNDGSGGVNDTRWGPVQIIADLPTADAAVAWTPSAGAVDNFTMVDDTPNPDDDTTYNESAVTNDTDLFDFPSWAAADAILAVQISNRARTDGGGSTLAAVTQNGGGVQAGSDQGIGSAYTNVQQIWDLDPSTGVAWDPADSPTFGYRKTA